MPSLLRSTSMDGYAVLARSVGVDPLLALAEVGMPVQALDAQESFISFNGFIRLLEYTAKAARCPDFGLRLAAVQESSPTGPLVVLMRHAATLEQAVQLAARHLFVLSPEIRLAAAPVQDDRQRVDVKFELAIPELRARAQTVELALGFVVQVLRLITQGQVRPLMALLPHPRLGPIKRYSDVLGCECRFEAGFAGIRLAASDLALPLPEHNPLLEHMARTYIAEHFGSRQTLFTERVRLLARQFLDSGEAKLSTIAELMAVHPKTLQRRLQSEGHQFNDLLDQIRRDRFQELLDQSATFSLTQLALLLGYSEQAALSRSCRRWFGCSPSELRRRAAAAGTQKWPPPAAEG